ncbi:MAG: flavin reductase family protein [Candidatus Humimicrobiaceae bacterium]
MVTTKEPKSFLAPLPVVLVTTRGSKDNIVALSWVGIHENKPPMLNINISKGKYSAGIIKETRQFGVCIPRKENIREVDICGSTHGDRVDKFSLTGFSKLEAERINVPLLKECPVRMECTLEKIIPFSSHDMFIGKVVLTHIEDAYEKGGKPDYSKLDMLCYVGGQYWSLGEKKENLFYTKT